jgi:superkiller protein 3
MRARGYRGPLVNLATAVLEMAERRTGDALKYLEEAERVNPDLPAVSVLIGQAYARLRQWPRARAAFEKAAALDADNESAWHGLAVAALAGCDDEAAAEHALRAVGLRPDYALAHYHLGVALSRMGRPRDAEAALGRALALQPNLLAACARLAELYEGPLDDPTRARAVRKQAQEIILRRRMGRRAKAVR